MGDEFNMPGSETQKSTAIKEGPSHCRLGRLVLVVVEGPDKGKQHHVEVNLGRVVKAGRNVTNELVIRDDAVSGTHFELAVQEEGIWLRDLNSKNGVYIHKTRVREALLDVESVFRVGGTSIKVETTRPRAAFSMARPAPRKSPMRRMTE